MGNGVKCLWQLHGYNSNSLLVFKATPPIISQSDQWCLAAASVCWRIHCLCRNEIEQYAAIEFAHLKGQEPLEDCYLVLAAQSLLCNTPSWTCHVVMFWTTEWLGPFSTVMDNGLPQSSDSLCHIMDQKLSLLILREVGEVLSHVHKICTCLYPCSSLVHGDVLQGGTSATQWQIIPKIKMIM